MEVINIQVCMHRMHFCLVPGCWDLVMFLLAGDAVVEPVVLSGLSSHGGS